MVVSRALAGLHARAKDHAPLPMSRTGPRGISGFMAAHRDGTSLGKRPRGNPRTGQAFPRLSRKALRPAISLVRVSVCQGWSYLLLRMAPSMALRVTAA